MRVRTGAAAAHTDATVRWNTSVFILASIIGSATAMTAHYLQASDCVLAVGSSLTRAPFTPVIPEGKTIVHATADPIDINKEYPAALGIVADAKLFLAQLAAELRRLVGEGRADRRAETAETIARIKRDWRAEYEPLFADDASPPGLHLGVRRGPDPYRFSMPRPGFSMSGLWRRSGTGIVRSGAAPESVPSPPDRRGIAAGSPAGTGPPHAARA